MQLKRIEATQKDYNRAEAIKAELTAQADGCFAPSGSFCDDTHCECCQIAFDQAIGENHPLVFKQSQ
ncbi:hypothetical protein [Pseudovibrio sp. POLY-S9]|uniref:hypothetical protein n=1 Tax=Pseudovibrio sp. POLY-S9 TaxID=1576596 RepID=UPI00070C3289|nr:hypothetical protein [Pseudovibrio sp. POLY-S9]